MPEWPLAHLTEEQARGYVHAAECGNGGLALQHLDHKAQGDLAGLSAFGESGNQPELLSQSVVPFLLTDRARTFDPRHIRSALLRLGFSEPGK